MVIYTQYKDTKEILEEVKDRIKVKKHSVSEDLMKWLAELEQDPADESALINGDVRLRDPSCEAVIPYLWYTDGKLSLNGEVTQSNCHQYSCALHVSIPNISDVFINLEGKVRSYAQPSDTTMPEHRVELDGDDKRLIQETILNNVIESERIFLDFELAFWNAAPWNQIVGMTATSAILFLSTNYINMISGIAK